MNKIFINFFFILKNNKIFIKKNFFGNIIIPKNIIINIEKNIMFINSNYKDYKILNSFIRNLKNLIKGVDNLWFKILEISGIGYKVIKNKNFLIFSLGYTNDYFLFIPNYIKIELIKNNIKIFSVYKDKIGNFSNKIINIKKYNPYKKKGIFFSKNFFIKKSTKKKQ